MEKIRPDALREKKKKDLQIWEKGTWEILLPLAYTFFLLTLGGFDCFFLFLFLFYLFKSRALPMNPASRNDPEELISEDALRLGFLH